jgi:LysM repeat protein
MEEEKESHYLAGKNCISSMDYKGAIEEFRTALKVNPDSASAHLQLGWLYEEKDPDPAASIYHYEQFLKLRPGYENAEVIRQHINNCKQDLAQTVLPLPVAPGMQHEFEQLAEENKRLREELEKWRLYANRLQTLTNPAGPLVMATRAGPPASTAPPGPNLSTSAPSTTGAYPLPGAAATRACTIKAGDSLYSIAKKFGVKLDAILAANPGLDPKRLRVGQTLNLPPP